jgi:uncharacterized protein
MSEGHHDLAHEFPEYKQAIHELKLNDAHFARLAGEYHQTCKELHRIDAGNETPADDYVEALKVRRLYLKDELYALLKGLSASA